MEAVAEGDGDLEIDEADGVWLAVSATAALVACAALAVRRLRHARAAMQGKEEGQELNPADGEESGSKPAGGSSKRSTKKKKKPREARPVEMDDEEI